MDHNPNELFMKKQSFLLFLSLLMWFGFMDAQTITVPTTNDNEITFEPASYPTFPKISGASSYRYFWNFGDGHFKIIDNKNNNLPADVKLPITYGYGQTGNYKARMELTQIYSPPVPPDDDVKRSGAPTVTIGSLSQPETGNNVNMLGSSLMIHPVREVRPGYPMTFIVTYDLNACRTMTGMLEWEFIFTYNSFTLAPPVGGVAAILEGYNSETLNISECSFGSGIDSLFINITRFTPPNPSDDERYTFFLNFEVPLDIKVGQPLNVKGSFGEFDPQGNIPPCDKYELPDIFVAKSYDPNYKLVSKDTISTNPAQLLHYIVHFQNTGEGPTDSIKVTDKLDPRLDPSTIQLTAMRIGYQYIPADSLLKYPNPALLPSLPYPWTTSNPTPVFAQTETQPLADSFVWAFKNAILRGTKESGYGEEFSELETTGSFEFDIYTYPFMEYGVVIENKVEIYFDDNPEVVTAPAQTIKYCCDQLADSMNKASFDLNIYFDATRYPHLMAYSLTSDSAEQGKRPVVQTAAGSFRFDYAPVAGGYSGLDVLSIIVCDNNTPPTCDTVHIHICANTDQKLANYPCDRTSVGIGENLFPAELRVYPNPAQDWVMIDYSSLGRKVQRIALYDLQGHKIQDIPFSETGFSKVSLSTLPAGLYILRVNERWVKKIMVR